MTRDHAILKSPDIVFKKIYDHFDDTINHFHLLKIIGL